MLSAQSARPHGSGGWHPQSLSNSLTLALPSTRAVSFSTIFGCTTSISMPIGSTVAKPSVARGAIFKVTRDRGAEGVEMDLFRRVSARVGLPMIRSGTASVLGTGLNYRYPAFAALRLSTEGAHAAGRRSVQVNGDLPFYLGVQSFWRFGDLGLQITAWHSLLGARHPTWRSYWATR